MYVGCLNIIKIFVTILLKVICPLLELKKALACLCAVINVFREANVKFKSMYRQNSGLTLQFMNITEATNKKTGSCMCINLWNVTFFEKVYK